MAPPPNSPTNLAAWLNAHLAQGESVFIADNNHLKPHLPRLISSETILQEIRYSGGVLILEGPQSSNAIVESLRHNTLNAATFRQQNYVPGRVREAPEAHEDILINATRLGTRVFFPERETAYDALARDPQTQELLTALYANTPIADCHDMSADELAQNAPEHLRPAIGRLASIVEERTSSRENGNIAQGILAQPGPHVIMYGAAHLAPIREHMDVTAIAVLETALARYSGKLENLPEYIYVADEDRVEHIPLGSPEREAFIAFHTNADTKPGHIGIPQTPEEMLACRADPAVVERSKPARLPEPVAP